MPGILIFFEIGFFLPQAWGWDVIDCITDLNLDGALHPIDAGYDEIGLYTNMDDWIQILEMKKKILGSLCPTGYKKRDSANVI